MTGHTPWSEIKHKGAVSPAVDPGAVTEVIIHPNLPEPYSVPMGAPRAIVVDLDGTVALKHDGRGHFEWDKVGDDYPNWAVIEVVSAVIEKGYIPIYVSGRMEQCREHTSTWLYGHGLTTGAGLLFMRPDGDHRNDAEVKLEIFDREIRRKYAILGVFDDRNRVVDMWRSIGLTVFQVAPGDF